MKSVGATGGRPSTTSEGEGGKSKRGSAKEVKKKKKRQQRRSQARWEKVQQNDGKEVMVPKLEVQKWLL